MSLQQGIGAAWRQGQHRLWPALHQRVRHYNFASAAYANSFGNLCPTNSEEVRKASVDYLRKFDVQQWYKDPICSFLNGKVYREGKEATTVDAFNQPNGKIVLSPPEVVDSIITHMRTYKPPKTDYRSEMRAIEQKLLSPEYAAQLVGNQAVDFKKQDGITGAL